MTNCIAAQAELKGDHSFLFEGELLFFVVGLFCGVWGHYFRLKTLELTVQTLFGPSSRRRSEFGEVIEFSAIKEEFLRRST